MSKILKKRILKTAMFALAVIVLSVTIIVFFNQSGAWLLDSGTWGEHTFKVGNIEFEYQINGGTIVENQNDSIDVQIPVIGGVKINDTTDNEQFAEENFNEGVTVVEIILINHSTVPVNASFEFSFENMYDSLPSNDLFYLILPSGSTVNKADKTVSLNGGNPQSYKTYISSIMNPHGTYAEMVSSLNNYYTLNPNSKHFATEFRTTGEEETYYVFIWSEYDPDDESIAAPVDWKNSDENVSKLTGQMTMTFGFEQDAE